MNFSRLAALVIRLWGLSFLFSGVMDITYIPTFMARVQRANQEGLNPADSEMMLQGMFVRTFLNVIVGTLLFLCWKPLANALTKGIRPGRGVDSDEFVPDRE